ncbi:geranylgeranyl transferase type I beta subunit [Mytilinidion resinicola]|uniref:Geranylgeranyl transferase type I beta subunit n=1 Tax=Mytilinidion resinicola TaxID=574789 RepID=A0A6A6YPL8_9PEZI|nr:geranylgeranyl transferase type I beta subunit [Mytilinidion resinicola]KAF2810468.1 geranylgeranyl transferase type I beta subunit [Mytilinidion resinicola]
MAHDPPPSAASLLTGEESVLNHTRHINYWRRCLKTFLPWQYTSNDSNRMSLAFFIVSALDLLGNLDSGISAEERQGFIDWVYHCQHPDGGFRAFPGTDLGELRNEENKIWDPANVPATFFALGLLIVLGDDLQKVKRRECLMWLTKMQRSEGGFGETLGEDGRIEGGNDTRFGYTGSGIRYMLRGYITGPVDGVPDIDVDKLVQCINISESYDGGISEAPFHEAHAGFTHCAISALYFLGRLPESSLPSGPRHDDVIRGITNLPLTLHWLASRQTAILDEEDLYDSAEDELEAAHTQTNSSFVKLSSFPLKPREVPQQDTWPLPHSLQWAGMNGRCNKIADTCYAFWVTGALTVLGHLNIIDRASLRRYLLDKTQHIVGGFGKVAGDPPDLYHAYLGLATLAIMGESGVKSFHTPLCFSQDANDRLEALEWRKKLIGDWQTESLKN